MVSLATASAETPETPPDPQEPPFAPHDPVDPGPRDSGPIARPGRSPLAQQPS